MPNFRYRALTEGGDLVTGVIAASTAADVVRRIDYLGLVPVEPVIEDGRPHVHKFGSGFGRRARAEDITTFTQDLALLLRAGARLDEALDLLAADADVGRLQKVIAAVRLGVLSGETLADALGCHAVFPPVYVALVRVGESSGALSDILEVLARERSRAEALRRKITDALRYPAFLLFAAIGVLVFFLTFVLPQFANILHEFGAKIDPIAMVFIAISDFVLANKDAIGALAIACLIAALFCARHRRLRLAMVARLSQVPMLRSLWSFYRSGMFCRNLDVLLNAGVPLPSTLGILAEIMTGTGDRTQWSRVIDCVRHGGKLSDSIAEFVALPAMAIRMLRLGEETGQLPLVARRVADFYETKLQRSLDRVVAFVGPAAIIMISIVIGGLIISVMTSLLSVSQLVG